MGDKLLRAAIAITALAEAAWLFVGTAFHLGMPVPARFFEPAYLPSTVLETVAGALLVYAVWKIVTRRPGAWQRTVTAHIVAVAAIVLGIGARATGRVPRIPTETGHHPAMLLVLIVVLVVLTLPPARRALGVVGRRARRRHRTRGGSNVVSGL